MLWVAIVTHKSVESPHAKIVFGVFGVHNYFMFSSSIFLLWFDNLFCIILSIMLLLVVLVVLDDDDDDDDDDDADDANYDDDDDDAAVAAATDDDHDDDDKDNAAAADDSARPPAPLTCPPNRNTWLPTRVRVAAARGVSKHLWAGGW